jgi:hypothetical protein
MEVSTKQLQIAELAATRPEQSFTSLNQYLDMDWMKEAYRRTRRESAPGVDRQTMEEYGKELESNLQELIGLAKSGRYHAPPVRRLHIPKRDGKETRPIGSLPAKIKCSKGRSRRYWGRYTNRTSWRVRSDSGRDARRTMPSNTSVNSAWIIR